MIAFLSQVFLTFVFLVAGIMAVGGIVIYAYRFFDKKSDPYDKDPL